MPRSWYAFVTGPLTDPRLPANYSLSNSEITCRSGRNICAIYANDGDISPSTPLSLNLLLYISNARVTGIPQPSTPGTKPYVYVTDQQ